MQKREITAIFLAAVLVTSAIAITSSTFTENAEALSEKKKDRDCNYKYEDCEREYRKYDPRNYDREYKEYEPKYIEKYNNDIKITEIEDPYEGYDH
ncbi:MAG: hypothetical protein ACPKPY_08385 [Nitrososphaeraceae archaeon]